MADLRLGKAGNFSVAEEDVDRWNSFIVAMEAAGYTADPTQSGGYNDRNVLGKNFKSQHAYGKAIDWNWTKNPEGSEGEFDPAVVDPIVQAHGLKWLRTRANKSDPMHFEVIPGSSWTQFVAQQQQQVPQLPGMSALGVQPTQSFLPNPTQPVVPTRAPAMNGLDLSSLLPQAPTTTLASTPVRPLPGAGGPANGGGGWSAWAADPVNQAALLAFGTRALTGSWGTPLQAFGEAAGAGMAAAQGQAEAERSTQASLMEKEAERENRLKIAETQAEGRLAVAEERGKNALMRASLTSAAKTPEEMKVADSVYKASLARGKADQILTGKSAEQIEAEARKDAEDALIAARVRRMGQLAVPAENTSGNSVNGPGQGGQPAPGKTGATAPATTNAQKWANFRKQPGVAEKLKEPEFQEKIRKQYPDFAQYLDQPSFPLSLFGMFHKDPALGK